MTPSRPRPTARRLMAAIALTVAGLATSTGLGSAPAGALDPPQCDGEVEAFVCGSYESFVDYTPSQGEVDYWAPLMPAKKTFFLATLGRSLESRRLIVEEFYWDYADRLVSDIETDYWVLEILKPDGPRRLQRALYDEWDSTPEDLVDWAYSGQMGRAASNAERTYWATVVETKGGGRMADLLGATLESRRTKVRFTYFNELGYSPDTASRDYWAERLRTGTSYLDMRIAIKSAGYPSSSGACSSFTPPVRGECEVE